VWVMVGPYVNLTVFPLDMKPGNKQGMDNIHHNLGHSIPNWGEKTCGGSRGAYIYQTIGQDICLASQNSEKFPFW
jgi:hypothetical protein